MHELQKSAMENIDASELEPADLTQHALEEDPEETPKIDVNTPKPKVTLNMEYPVVCCQPVRC